MKTREISQGDNIVRLGTHVRHTGANHTSVCAVNCTRHLPILARVKDVIFASDLVIPTIAANHSRLADAGNTAVICPGDRCARLRALGLGGDLPANALVQHIRIPVDTVVAAAKAVGMAGTRGACWFCTIRAEIAPHVTHSVCIPSSWGAVLFHHINFRTTNIHNDHDVTIRAGGPHSKISRARRGGAVNCGGMNSAKILGIASPNCWVDIIFYSKEALC